ncbi:cell adhesion molecule 4-like [Amphiura filiformis]|uniref:cell adhesion molecule 4-like n=1 Tax=Amphiura filiformis TaxID=82378 RepID=UPI003B2208FF
MEDKYSYLIAIVTLLLHHFDRVTCIFVTEWPVSVSTFENSTVEFFCEVHEKDDSMHLVWFTDMQPGDNRVSFNFANETVELNHENNGGQHSMEYDDTSGVQKLAYRITDVKVADEGLYSCGYIPLPIPQAVSSENFLGEIATLEVLIPPLESHPRCEVTGFDLIPFTNSSAIGLPLDLRCEIQGGRPTPDLTWYRNSDSVANGAEVNLLQHVLSADDNGVEFSCVASGKALMTNTSCSVTPLRIPPTASITSSSSYVTTGMNVTLICKGDGLPHISEIEWFVNGISPEKLEDFEYEIYDEQTGSESLSELNIFNSNFAKNEQ